VEVPALVTLSLVPSFTSNLPRRDLAGVEARSIAGSLGPVSRAPPAFSSKMPDTAVNPLLSVG